MAFGSALSAVSGFDIDMEYRGGGWWRTDDHASPGDPPPACASTRIGEPEERLLVAVGVMRSVIGEVQTYAAGSGLAPAPVLHLEVGDAIASAQRANALVQVIKREIAAALDRSGGKTIHLFLAGPAFLALFLGHRLNATAPVQCYERVAPGQYVPTCRLAV